METDAGYWIDAGRGSATVSRDNPPQTSGAGLEQCGPRRLPLYFLLDFSAAPAPGVAAAAEEHARQIIAQLQLLAANREDYQGAPVYYTIIVFLTSALQLHPMAPPWAYPFAELRLEAIEPQGEPGFAAAFDAVGRSCEHELKMPGRDNGDSQPLAFLFTDCFRPEKMEESLLPPNGWFARWSRRRRLRPFPIRLLSFCRSSLKHRL